MALSMPLNGLKEEDKEPLIELFVKHLITAKSACCNDEGCIQLLHQCPNPYDTKKGNPTEPLNSCSSAS